MTKVTAPTPWDTTVTYWAARGSCSGVEVAELCCGAFATFAAAASQVSLRPSITMDYDRARCAHVQTWWTEHWTPCTHICGDISQKPHWFRLSQVDVWAIGIPCQSTSTAGNRRGRADRRDLYGTLVELLTYVRPPQVLVEIVPGFWDQTSPHLAQLLEDLTRLPYITEAMEFHLKNYVPQHRKRGCLVLTRLDVWRHPEDTLPDMDHPWPRPLRPPPPATAYLEALCPDNASDLAWRVPPDLVAQLSPEARSPSWPGIPEFTRVLGDRAGTVMRAYGKPEEFPYPWYSQITPFGDSYRWLTPRELARLQGIPDSIPVPADRFHAYAAIGDALPPLAAGFFLARAATRLKTVPNPGTHWEETWLRKWTRATDPSRKNNPGGPQPSPACAFCGAALPHGSSCTCVPTQDIGPRLTDADRTHHGHAIAVVLLPRSYSHLLWTQDKPTGVWTLPYVRLRPDSAVSDNIRRTLEYLGWTPTISAFHWASHPACSHENLSLIFLRGAEWYHPNPHPSQYSEGDRIGQTSSQLIERIGLFQPRPHPAPAEPGDHDPNKARRIGEASHPGPVSPDICTICMDEVSDTDPAINVWCPHAMHGSCFESWARRGDRQTARIAAGCPTCRGPVYLSTSENFQWLPTQHPKQMLALMILERCELLLRSHYHDGPRNAALQRVLLHLSMERCSPWTTWPPKADQWTSYFMRLWECMAPPTPPSASGPPI